MVAEKECTRPWLQINEYKEELRRIALCMADNYFGRIKIEINVDSNKKDAKIYITEYE